MIPSCLSSTSHSSSSLQIIPFDVSPLIFDFSITNPGLSSAPGSATGTIIPAETFGAPQII